VQAKIKGKKISVKRDARPDAKASIIGASLVAELLEIERDSASGNVMHDAQ
jgi:hypothetical protein